MPNHPLDVAAFERIVFFTGAGLSAASGLPTYRGQGGIWKEYDYRTHACQEAFDADPDAVWEFHDQRRAKAASVEPNDAHRTIAAVQRTVPGTRVITQNIDGLHQRGGSRDVVELHGSLWRVRCDREGRSWEDTSVPLRSRRCDCGAPLRPDIVWFGDTLDEATLREAVEAVQQCDLLVSIGTSLVVYPAAQLPELARVDGATCVEINTERTEMSDRFDVVFRATAEDGLAALWPELAIPPGIDEPRP